MKCDLHTHSTRSDGSYTPSELVQRAKSAGIEHLALSDHDCTDGLAEAAQAAVALGICLIPAVEISVSWQGKSLHVVGLNIDPEAQPLRDGLRALQATRLTRAEEMGRRLHKAGVPGAYQAARALAGEGMITRTHFARFLMAEGYASTPKDVFSRYLTPGRPGYVATEWAPLETVVTWIRAAGGIATLAHPLRYKLTGSGLRRLFTAFKEAGGEAVEVIAGAPTAHEVHVLGQQARHFGFLASVGSDYHGTEQGWLELGRLPALPAGVTPVWSRWDG